MRVLSKYQWVAVVCAAVSIGGCWGGRDYGVETFPVKGVVYVDGAPAGKLSVTLHQVGGMDAANPTFSATITNDDGSFAVSTFEQGDGVPAGDYVATFSWGEFNAFTRSMEKDKLDGKYNDPQSSTFKVTVQPGEPLDMGRIDLQTK